MSNYSEKRLRKRQEKLMTRDILRNSRKREKESSTKFSTKTSWTSSLLLRVPTQTSETNSKSTPQSN